jgi:hypothetical protein
MPQIPTYTAQLQSGGVPQSPDVIPQYPTPDIGAGISQLAQPLAHIAGNLQRQQDDIEYARMVNDYETGIKAIRFGLDKDPAMQESPNSYSEAFASQAQTLNDSILESARGKNSVPLYRNYVRNKFGGDSLEASAQGYRLFASSQVALLDQTTKNMLDQYVTAQNPKDAEEITNAYMLMIDRAAVGDEKTPGIISSEQAIKRKAAWRPLAQEHTMQYLAKTDRDTLRRYVNNGAFNAVPAEKQASILYNANQMDEAEQRRTVQTETRLENDYHMQQLALANTGFADQATIDEGKMGNNPIIKDPRKWNDIDKLNKNPGASDGNRQVALIESRLALSTTVGNAERQAELVKGIGELQEVVAGAGHQIPDATKLADHLRSELYRIRGIEASGRAEGRAVAGAERGEDAAARAERNEKIAAGERAKKRALLDYETRMPPVDPIPYIGALEKAQRQSDKATILRYMDSGMSEQDAVDAVMKRVTPDRLKRGNKTPPAYPGTTPAPGKKSAPVESKSGMTNQEKIDAVLGGMR